MRQLLDRLQSPGPLGFLLVSVLALAGASESRACSCAAGVTLTYSFESATWVVLASVAATENNGRTSLAVLEVDEQFKGPELDHIALSKSGAITSCHFGLVEGDTWLLFLYPSKGNDDRPAWPSACAGHVALTSDAFVDAERAASHLAALRSRDPDSTTPPEDPWLFRERPSAACSITKHYRGPRGVGRFSISSHDDELFVRVGFFPKRKPSYPRVDDSRDLRVDIAGDLHEISPSGDLRHQRGRYQAAGGSAELLFNQLQTLEPPWLELSLGDEFRTDVGVFGLQAAVEKLDACRVRERKRRAGWLEVMAMRWRQPPPMRFSWSVARADSPSRPVAQDRGNGDWEELSAGDYVVSGWCYGEEQRRRVKVVEGQTERLTIRCGNWSEDD